MKKKNDALCLTLAMLIAVSGFAGCAGKTGDASGDGARSSVEESEGGTNKSSAVSEETPKKETKSGTHAVSSDLKPSEGLLFESNGDGTCTVKGIGQCKDTDIVITTKSPDGDEVTLIEYGDFVGLTISDCELEIGESAFASCEELKEIKFTDSTITAGEYAFLSSGDSAAVEMTNCTLSLDDRAFEYSSLSSLTITGEKTEIGKSGFACCEDLASVKIDCNSLKIDEYAFLTCDDLTTVSICDNGKSDNKVTIDDGAFPYCKRLENVVIGGGEVTFGKYVFSGCDTNPTVSVDGKPYSDES